MRVCKQLIDEAASTEDYETAFNKVDEAASLMRKYNEKHAELAALTHCVEYLKKLQQYNKAIEYQHRVMELRRMFNDTKKTFLSLVILGTLYLYVNRLDEAIETFEEARKCKEFEICYRIECLNNLFVTYQRSGYTDRAKVIIEELGQIVSQGSDEDKTVYLEQLATIDKSKSFELLQKALQTVKPQSPEHARILNNMAVELIQQGKFKAAKDLLNQAQTMVTEKHTTYGMIFINMSVILMEYQDYRGARAAHKAAFAYYKKLIQENKPIGCSWQVLSNALIEMGDLQMDNGKALKAIAYYEKAIRFGGSNKATLRLLCANGSGASAIKEAVRDFMSTRHDDVESYIFTLLRVSSKLAHQDAVDVVEEACHVAEKTFGIDNVKTCECKIKLAALKKPEEAERLFAELEKCLVHLNEEAVAHFYLQRGLIMKNVDDLRKALHFFGDDANTRQIQEARKLLK